MIKLQGNDKNVSLHGSLSELPKKFLPKMLPQMDTGPLEQGCSSFIRGDRPSGSSLAEQIDPDGNGSQYLERKGNAARRQ